MAIADEMRRSPYGERGLKSSQSKNRRTASQSLPLRGAWIEILAGSIHFFGAWSLPLRGAWIEIGGGSAAPVSYTHLYLGEKIPWGLVPYVQALLLARTLRDDLEEYPPFLWK